MANAGTAIDVVRTKNDSRELLSKIILLVRRSGRTENADALGSVFGNDLLELIGCVIDRLVP